MRQILELRPWWDDDTRLMAKEATYLRQSGQKVLVVKLRPLAPGVAPTPAKAYAVWPVSW